MTLKTRLMVLVSWVSAHAGVTPDACDYAAGLGCLRPGGRACPLVQGLTVFSLQEISYIRPFAAAATQAAAYACHLAQHDDLKKVFPEGCAQV